MSDSDLKRLANTGVLNPTDLVWKDGLGDWVPASKVKGLFPDAPASPPPLPPAPIDEDIIDDNKIARAEHNHLQATFCLADCQTHLGVYHKHLTDKANDGIELVDAALKDCPDSSEYLNTKALLLSDGLGQHKAALARIADPDRWVDADPTDGPSSPRQKSSRRSMKRGIQAADGESNYDAMSHLM